MFIETCITNIHFYVCTCVKVYICIHIWWLFCRIVVVMIKHLHTSKWLIDAKWIFFQVMWKGDAGKININGTDYKLIQCHWHSPSEHTFNGSRFLFAFFFSFDTSTGHLIFEQPTPYIAFVSIKKSNLIIWFQVWLGAPHSSSNLQWKDSCCWNCLQIWPPWSLAYKRI